MAGRSQVTSKHLPILGLLFCGTLNSLFSKVVYQLRGEGRYGREHLFEKPLATTALMFIAMALCIPISLLVQFMQYEKEKKHIKENVPADQTQPLLEEKDKQWEESSKKTRPKDFLILLIPTAFDLTATVLMSVGLLYVTASVYQMLRGSEMLFAAIFSVVFLRRPLNKMHHYGILGCMAGITLVGLSSVLGQEGGVAQGGVSQAQIWLGMGLIVVSQAVQAAQVTVEDYAMQDVGFEPLTVVGVEGVYGSILMLGVVLPLAQQMTGQKEGQGIHEDSIDTWDLIKNDPTISIVLAVNILCLTAYNVAGMYVTEEVGAAARTVLETLRTMFVWVADLGLYYSHLTKGLGEKWINPYSYLQLAGFVVLVIGTLVYSKGEEYEAKTAPPPKEGEILPKRRDLNLKHTLTISYFKHRPIGLHRFRTAVHGVMATQAFRRQLHNDFAQHGLDMHV